MPVTASRKRDWCFTIHSGHFGDMTEQEVIVELQKVNCSYIVFQQETGAARDGGLERDHIQGYIQFTAQKTLAQAKRLMPCDAHMAMRAAPKISDAVDYCKKAETRRAGCNFFEVGVQPMDQGVKRTLAEACKMAKTKGYKAVAKEMPEEYVKFSRGLEKLDNIWAQDRVPRFRDITIIVVYGNSGCGKSYFAEHYDDAEDTYPTGDLRDLWLDGYSSERTLVIEEMEGKTPYRQLLRLLDGYRYNMPTKGGHVWANYTTVIITSNNRPEQWYGEDMWSTDPRIPDSPLQRRITSIHCGSGVYPNCIWDVPLPTWAGARDAAAEASQDDEPEGDIVPPSPMDLNAMMETPAPAELGWMEEFLGN